MNNPLKQVFTLAGLCSGLTEALVINPFEVVKVKLQAERSQFTEVRLRMPKPFPTYSKSPAFYFENI